MARTTGDTSHVAPPSNVHNNNPYLTQSLGLCFFIKLINLITDTED